MMTNETTNKPILTPVSYTHLGNSGNAPRRTASGVLCGRVGIDLPAARLCPQRSFNPLFSDASGSAGLVALGHAGNLEYVMADPRFVLSYLPLRLYLVDRCAAQRNYIAVVAGNRLDRGYLSFLLRDAQHDQFQRGKAAASAAAAGAGISGVDPRQAS